MTGQNRNNFFYPFGHGSNGPFSGLHNLTFYAADSNNNFNYTEKSNFTANSPPHPPTLIVPRNLTVDDPRIVNRTTPFSWNNSVDSDNDIFSYHLQVDDNSDFLVPEINVSSIFNTSPENVTYYSTIELAVDTVYYWRVRANDTYNWSNYSMIANFTVQSYLSFSLLTNKVPFGGLLPGQKEDTYDRDPPPFRGENAGNINMNITINGSQLFVNGGFPSGNYQYNITQNESET